MRNRPPHTIEFETPTTKDRDDMADYDDRSDQMSVHSDRHHRRGRRSRSRSWSRSRSRSRSPDYHRGRGRGWSPDHHRRGSPRSGSRSWSRSRSRSPDYHRGRGRGGSLDHHRRGSPRSSSRSWSRSRSRSPDYHRGRGRGGSPDHHRRGSPLPNSGVGACELFIGNIPPGAYDALLMDFLNGAMQRVGLCSPGDTPIIHCRFNAKFAFVEASTIDLTNKALNLNGIPFLGASLRVSRPSKYMGPHVPSQTWQQLTGEPLPPGVTPVPENSSGNPEDKISRELFVGNTTAEMTETMLRDFLGGALEQVGLTTMPGNPILACRVSGKFAFVELRSREEATNALNLNGIPYLGAQLRMARPNKYTGPETPHGNWGDIFARFMSGELQLKNGAALTAAPSSAAEAPVGQQPTAVVSLRQMLAPTDLEEDVEYNNILEDTRDECSSFGALKNVVIPRAGPGATKVYLEYASVEDAGRAIAGMTGRIFDGRKVEAVYFDQVKFANQDYSD